jgi:predicted aspartyl protease
MVPTRLVAQLGLRPTRSRSATTVGGQVRLQVYEAVRLAIQGRDCVVEVYEVSNDLPVLIGQVPLELLDWVVDPQGQRLIGNPAHGGEHMIDALGLY